MKPSFHSKVEREEWEKKEKHQQIMAAADMFRHRYNCDHLLGEPRFELDRIYVSCHSMCSVGKHFRIDDVNEWRRKDRKPHEPTTIKSECVPYNNPTFPVKSGHSFGLSIDVNGNKILTATAEKDKRIKELEEENKESGELAGLRLKSCEELFMYLQRLVKRTIWSYNDLPKMVDRAERMLDCKHPDMQPYRKSPQSDEKEDICMDCGWIELNLEANEGGVIIHSLTGGEDWPIPQFSATAKAKSFKFTRGKVNRFVQNEVEDWE